MTNTETTTVPRFTTQRASFGTLICRISTATGCTLRDAYHQADDTGLIPATCQRPNQTIKSADANRILDLLGI